MVGQKNLIKVLSRYTIDTFPRSSLFLGERGSGRHTLVEYLGKDILNIPVEDITEKLSEDFISYIYRSVLPFIYIINVDALTEKEQNVMLKLIEEPPVQAFMILICENRNNLLDTIYNRCFVFEMEPYSEEELASFIEEDTDDALVLMALRTPGKILNTNLSNLMAVKDLCETIADKIQLANFSNTLTIVNKINYKDEYNKFDLNIFLDLLVFTLFNKYLKENNEKVLNMYLCAINERKKLIDSRLNKEVFMQHFLTKLWKVSRS